MPETSARVPPDENHVTDEPPLQPHADARERHAIEREATELAVLRRQYSRASSHRRPGQSIASREPKTALGRFLQNIARFWSRQVSITVPHESCRDHLALERTFLGYLRTSLALSMLGVTIAQLFRLQHAPSPNEFFGFFVLGKPLSCICQGSAIFTLIIGAFRTWRVQNAMVRGMTIAGGLEIASLAAGLFLILLLLFVLVMAVNINKSIIPPYITSARLESWQPNSELPISTDTY